MSTARADTPSPAPGDLRLWLAVAFAALLVIALIVSAALLRNALAASPWNIADALSEEAEITLRDAQGQPLRDQEGKAVIGSELRASTSRFVAMFGLIAILILYFGFGIVLIARLAANVNLPSPPEMEEIRTFLFAGVTLFAPYAVNKFSSVFDWLKPPPRP